jgi:ATP-binding cassette subfamily B (MDR/TAP) protein 1
MTATQKQKRSSCKHLFVFSSPLQVVIMPLAVIMSFTAAAGKAIYAILLGKIFDVVSRFGAHLLSGDETLSQVSLWCSYLCILGVVLWVFNGLEMSLWMISGELRAGSARKTLFSSLVDKHMEWYDSKEEGVPSLMVQIQR